MFQRISQRILISLVLVLVLQVTPAGAAPLGTAFTYQGQLTANGGPANSLHDFEFRLFDDPSGGTQIGPTLTFNDVQVNGGLFSVVLDFGSMIFVGEARWLEVDVRRSSGGQPFTTLTPRQELLPVPSAMYSSTSEWTGLRFVPPGFADGVDNDSLAQMVCGAGQILQFNGGWTCANANSGDVTGVLVQAGSGLTGGGLAGDVTIGVNPAVIQKRVSGSCPAGQAIRVVNQNGTVDCTTLSPPSSAVAESGWMTAPKRTVVPVDLGTTAYDFVFGMVRASQNPAGSFMAPIMGSALVSYMPAYVGLFGSTATVDGYNYLAALNDPGNLHNVLVWGGEVQLRAFQRTPDYDTGWSACSRNVTYVFTHGLGVLPTFAIVEVAENSDGSGWRVPTMSSSYSDGSAWHQTAIVAMDTSTVSLRTHGSLAQFRSTAAGTSLTPIDGFCRVQLFNWTPDYDSGWTAISTDSGNRDKWFPHHLGQVPSLMMLWVAEGPNGSGSWMLPAMSPALRGYIYGTSIYNVTEDWVTIKGGSARIAQFVNASGASTSPTSGFVRYLAWR